MKHFTYRNQLLAILFGQQRKREGLRDLIITFEAHRAKQYHLGLGRKPINGTQEKGLVLHSKRIRFGVQNESFCCLKGALLKGKRSPFGMQNILYWILSESLYLTCSSKY